MTIPDPGLPRDPDHEAFRDLDGLRVRDDTPEPSIHVVQIGSAFGPTDAFADVPLFDWIYTWPNRLGRAAPGARSLRWNRRRTPVTTDDDGPGALWCTSAAEGLLPAWAPKAADQRGVSRAGIYASGGITRAAVVIVDRAHLFEVAEYADALLVNTGTDEHPPLTGVREWSLALGNGPTGARFGLRVGFFDTGTASDDPLRRFAEAVDADWVVDYHTEFDGDGCDRLKVTTAWGSEVYHWDHGTIHVVDPERLELRLDHADVRTLHDVVDFLAARRSLATPWFIPEGD